MKKICCALLITVGISNQCLSMERVSSVKSLWFTTQYCSTKTAQTLYVDYESINDECVTIEQANNHDGKQLKIFEGSHDWDGYSRLGKFVQAFQNVWKTNSSFWGGVIKDNRIDLADYSNEENRVVKLSGITSSTKQKYVAEKLVAELGISDSVFEILHLLYPNSNHQAKIPTTELKRCSDISTVDNMPNGIASTEILFKDTEKKETKVRVLSHTSGTVSVDIEGGDANKIPGYLRLLTEQHDCFAHKGFTWHKATAEDKEHRSLELRHKGPNNASEIINPALNPCYSLATAYLRGE